MKKISVVIPTYNSKIIMETIKAIKEQTYPQNEIEIVIVGVDESGELKKLKEKNIKFIETDIRFALPGYNRNVAIENSQGEFLFFTDSDCIPCKKWIEKLMAHHKEGYGIVGGSINIKSANFWALCDNISHFYEHLNISKSKVQEHIPTTNLSMKKELFLKGGKFDGKLVTGEDKDLIMKLRRQGHKLYFDNTAFVLHYHPRNSFKEVLIHSFAWGMSGILLRKKYKDLLKFPKILFNRQLLLLSSPLLAFLITCKIYINPKLWRYIHTAPIVFLSKIAWCFGAYKSLKNET